MSLFLGCALGAATETPWTDSFTMEVQGQQRTFVTWKSDSWMSTTVSDVASSSLATDVMFPAKIRSTPARGGKGALHGLANAEISASADTWNGVVEEDNVYVLARIEPGSPMTVRIRHLLPAPGDRDLIAQRLAKAAATDWDARLAACRWIREQAATQGNREFWSSQADLALLQLIADATAHAREQRQASLLEKAVGWSLEDLHDPHRAASAASQTWLVAVDAAAQERITGRMRALGFAPYQGVWLQSTAALTKEYNDRFALIAATDAEGFFRLGRWADAQGDRLPHYKELTYRAFQTGLAADPRHAGIRRELGLSVLPVEAGRPAAVVATPTVGVNEALHSSGVRVPAAPGWQMILSNATHTFVSDTAPKASIEVSFVPGATDAESMLEATVRTMAARSGFAVLPGDEVRTLAGSNILIRAFTFEKDGSKQSGRLVIVIRPGNDIAVRLVCEEGEQPERTRAAIDQSLGGIIFPASTVP